MNQQSKLPKALYDQFYGKILDGIEFNGETFPARTLKVNHKDPITVSTSELYDTIHPGDWEDENEGFLNKEAEEIYNDIFFFIDTNREIYTLSDYDLKVEIMQSQCETMAEFIFTKEELLVYKTNN